MRLRTRRRPRGIPTADAGAFRRTSRRTLVMRWVVVVAVVALLLAALAGARDLETRASDLVPGGRSAVVVLDLSLSISQGDYVLARGVLERLIESGVPMGLVAFSDVPYELVPPGTPAVELRSLLRFLTPVRGALPTNPWTQEFQGGTKISGAIELAEDMLRRDGAQPGSVILVSDLQTAPDDLGTLGRTLARIDRSPTLLRIVPLGATGESLTLFQSLLGGDVFVDPVESSFEDAAEIEAVLRGRTPRALLVLASLALLGLGLHERLSGRLRLPRAGEGST